MFLPFSERYSTKENTLIASYIIDVHITKWCAFIHGDKQAQETYRDRRHTGTGDIQGHNITNEDEFLQ